MSRVSVDSDSARLLLDVSEGNESAFHQLRSAAAEGIGAAQQVNDALKRQLITSQELEELNEVRRETEPLLESMRAADAAASANSALKAVEQAAAMAAVVASEAARAAHAAAQITATTEDAAQVANLVSAIERAQATLNELARSISDQASSLKRSTR
jgi:hypothetical protein